MNNGKVAPPTISESLLANGIRPEMLCQFLKENLVGFSEYVKFVEPGSLDRIKMEGMEIQMKLLSLLIEGELKKDSRSCEL